MKDQLAYNEVKVFKENFCNENEIIIDLIKSKLDHYFIEPILDVGYGLGDIDYYSLYNKRVICIDINSPPNGAPKSPYHEYVNSNFFDFQNDYVVKTLFISHTLQFIDDDLTKLMSKISEINPKRIIIVRNKNTGLFGQILDWFTHNVSTINPEVDIVGFPYGFIEITREPFNAEIKCPSFELLITQLEYLMMGKVHAKKRIQLADMLMQSLHQPGFSFEQEIVIYERNEQS